MMPKVAQGTGAIQMNMVDGRRKAFPAKRDFLLRILDGRKRQVMAPWVKGVVCHGNRSAVPR